MTNEALQAIMNSTFSGLAFFCRDLDLEERLIARYQPRQMLLERGFTDASHKIGGMVTNCRYLIASSQAKDLSRFSPNPEYGPIMIQSGAFFKVLDIQRAKGKTQILLLNIPPEGVPIFATAKINIEDQLIEKGREIFEQTLASDPLPALQTKDWAERTSLPIGMNEAGVFFMDMQQVDTDTAQPAGEKSTSPDETPTNIPKSGAQPTKGRGGFWNKLFGQ